MVERQTYSRAKARSGRRINIAAAFDADDDFAPRTMSLSYDLDISRPDPRGDQYPPNHWGQSRLDFSVSGIALYRSPIERFALFAYLSTEGDVLLSYSPGYPRERIPGVGISFKDGGRYGRMSHLRQIGRHLYAVGDGGQVYRRDDAPFGDGVWLQLDPDLLQDPQKRVAAFDREYPDDYLSDLQKFSQAMKEIQKQGGFERVKNYFCVNGPNENEIYVCGSDGTLFWWDGIRTRDLHSATQASLTSILIAPDGQIYVCGRNGTLLAGDCRRGFSPVAGFVGGQNFTSMAWFRGKLYLGSASGPRALWVHDFDGPRRVYGAPDQPLDDVNVIDAADDEALWIVGAKTFWRWDGESFQQVHDPDMQDGETGDQPPASSAPIANAWSKLGYPDDIVRRINCYGMGDWIAELAAWLGHALAPGIAADGAPAVIGSSVRDTSVTLRRRAEAEGWDSLILERVEMGPRALMPLSLSISSETPATAASKLGNNFTGDEHDDRFQLTGGRRLSFFVDGGVVVELTFGSNNQGILRLVAVGLGANRPWTGNPRR